MANVNEAEKVPIRAQLGNLFFWHIEDGGQLRGIGLRESGLLLPARVVVSNEFACHPLPNLPTLLFTANLRR